MVDDAKTQTDSGAEESTGPVGLIGTVISRRKPMSWHKAALIIAGIGLAVAGGLLYWALDRHAAEQARQTAIKKQEQVTTQAQQAVDLQQFDKASQTLAEQRAALDPVKDRKAYADVTLSLAKSQVGEKKYDDAIKLYEELVADKEYELDAKRGLGQAYLAKGDKEQARKYFQEVVAIVRTKQDPESQFRLTMDESQLNAVSQ